MRNFLRSLILVSFFFAMRNPTEIPGVVATTIIAGFKDKAACEQYRMETKDMVDQLGIPNVKFSNCEEQQDV